MNQRAVGDAILQLQAKGDVFTRQVIIEQRRVDDINGVSRKHSLTTCGSDDLSAHGIQTCVTACAIVPYILVTVLAFRWTVWLTC